jgi:hypothetical protein
MAALPPKRTSIQPKLFGTYATEADLKKADPNIDELANKVSESSDDFDWAPPVPGRPSPFGHTWNSVYVGLANVAGTPGVSWSIRCEEGCGQLIPMNGSRQEVGSSSTPHDKPRKPPVCHKIPWAHLNEALQELEQIEKHGGRARSMKDSFKRYVCWGDTNNLRPGHNGCNAVGMKETASTYSGSKKAAAVAFVERCVIAPEAGDVWST